MSKKLITIAIVISIFLGITTISHAALIDQQFSKDKASETINAQEVYLGRATIIGDGIKENTTVNASAENDLLIRTESQTSNIDFYIDYSMNCNGLDDIGGVTLSVQLNGKHEGINVTNTTTSKGGALMIKNVTVQRGDNLTFEIVAVYTNFNPFFVINKGDGGFATFSKKTHVVNTAACVNLVSNSPTILFRVYQLERFLTHFPLLARHLYLEQLV